MNEGNKVIPNVVFRTRAKAALKPVMPVVILCALIANLPSLAAQTLSILTDSNPVYYLLGMASTDEELVTLLGSNEAILAAFSGFLTTERIISLALYALSYIVSPVLMLGLTHVLLRTLRGQEIEVTTVFSRLGSIGKSILLTLLTVVKLLAWSIPGGVVMVFGMVLMLLLGQTWPLLVYLAGLVLMIVHMVRAMLNYTMSTVYLADDPSIGVRAALKRSIRMMRKRKMALLALTLSVYAWLIVGSLVESMLSSLFGTVIASTLYMALQLVISVYLSACHCAFYEGYREDA